MVRQSKYQRQLRGSSSSGGSNARGNPPGDVSKGKSEKFTRKYTPVDRQKQRDEGDAIDTKFGFLRYVEGSPRLGWLLNYLPTTIPDESGMDKSGLDLYFIDRNGENFKASIVYAPYFYIDAKEEKNNLELMQHLQKRFETCRVELIQLEDLDMPNHLSGKTHQFIKISFGTVAELVECKNILRPYIKSSLKTNRRNVDNFDPTSSVVGVGVCAGAEESSVKTQLSDPLAYISDMRENDVPYAMRCGIDLNLRVGAWFVVTPMEGTQLCDVNWQKDFLELGEPRILAFDIECEKSPLKFPNSETDRIFMISYMTNQQGYLIVNREIVSEDIQDFEYTPNSKFPGLFQVINVANEEQLLRKFIQHVQSLRPHVIVTYNGDFFDWPYVDNRCNKFGISLYKEVGIRATGTAGGNDSEYLGRCIVHLDAFCWVKRDSYLPQGNQGLKAVTRCKLGYDPVEIDPEDMLRFAKERPDYMASYSVSDAVATYYLYYTYVHNFIFSLSTIIPMGPEDVLRKGSGTLCEALLMVEAFRGNIVCPNKDIDPPESYHNGHLLDSETYIGGHVECLEAGIFRADITNKFTLIPSALQMLIDHIDRDLTFALEIENGIQRSDISNYDEIKQEIVMSLEMLRDSPIREEMPLIYHLDVGAMYPNIILTNRLQPSAIVNQNICASCEFNQIENNCKRHMTWTWRGDYNPASLSEYNSIKRQLMYEKIGDKPFSELSENEQLGYSKLRLKQYSQKVYKRSKITTTEERVHTVCMRENSFYVDTVRAFRDRRYEYKLLTKQWKGKKIQAERCGDVLGKKNAESKEILMDSLQVAHKCILNSFYGYVMRKGARWRSMEMAGIVTHTGSQIITQARILIEQVGRPLELDTDGIWCILPISFPQEYKFKLKTTAGGGTVHIDYPCAMLNADVHDRYTNHQYQDLNKNQMTTSPTYSTHSECSIYFELDGPYKAMVLPASPEEGVLLKKKYVVFNFDNSIAELKGFELKRRGELELVKAFQSQVFDQFLNGTTLQECYDSVGRVGNLWLDVLDSHGANMDDQELMELISERKTISKTLSEYEGRKATSLTTAHRLSDFLGAEMVKDKGLNCNLIVAKYPSGAPVTERAIPVAIFQAEPAIKTFFLRKWLQNSTIDCDDFRNIVDWDYYKDRLGKTIQKIITIPAGMQRIANPCPRVEHPVWVKRILQEMVSKRKQATITSLFGGQTVTPPNSNGEKFIQSVADIEDFGSRRTEGSSKIVVIKKRNLNRDQDEEGEGEGEEENEDEGAVEGGEEEVTTTRNTSTLTNKELQTSKPVHEKPKIDPMSVAKPETLEKLEEWLEERKSEWRNLRNMRQRERLGMINGARSAIKQYGLTTKEFLFGAAGTVSSTNSEETDSRKKRVGLEDLMKNAARAVTHGYWQVVELQETDSPGIFIAWSFTGQTQLQKLFINIPRIIYVNCRGGRAEVTAKELGGRVVKKDLPHGRPVYSLYEIHLQENKYIKNERALGLFLCDPLVEGVYETKTPLSFRAILRLGCVVNVSKSSLGDGRDGLSASSAFKLKDLKFVNISNQKYLEIDSASYKKIFIYHVEDSRRTGTGVVGLFIVSETNHRNPTLLEAQHSFSAKAFIWMVQPRGVVERPPMQKIFRRFCNDEKNSCKFTTTSVANMNSAFASCNEILAAYIRERRGPTIVIGQSLMDSRGWRKSIPLLHQFPLVTMPANSKDEKFPPIAWQIRICNIMTQRFLLFPQWFDDRLSCARYAHIPIGNLGRDVNLTMTDIIFGRQLEHNRQVLWAAPGPLPDIGGAELDLHNILTEAMRVQVISDEGVYRSVCVELEIFGFAVASVMGSGLLDAQGITTIPTNQANNTLELGSVALPHDAACARAFNLLKASVTKWIHDVGVNGDLHSDALLMGLYRFLCGSGQTLLYDPALYRVVHILMTKLFSRLIIEFRNLGCKIVYSDFYRIIIVTNRYDYSSAKEYAEFIIGAIVDRDLFQCLQINIKQMWNQLIWLDPANWSGVPLLSPESIPNEAENVKDSTVPDTVEIISTHSSDEADIEENEIDSNENNNNNNHNDDEYDFLDQINEEVEIENTLNLPFSAVDESFQEGNEEDLMTPEDNISRIESSWDLSSHLPTAASAYLRHTIDQFLLIYQDQWTAAVEEMQARNNKQNKSLSSSEYMECGEVVRKFMQQMIRSSLEPQLLHTVDILLHQYSSHDEGHGNKGNSHQIALNFVKYITKILSLDSSLGEEVSSLRRTLLTQLSMKEFNSQSEFEDSSPSYILRDLICSYCNTCKDIDLLRDPILTGKDQLQKDSAFDHEMKTQPNWHCSHCGNSYDVVEVEQRLLDDLEKMIASYLIQDFRCPKTNLVSTKNCTAVSDLCLPLKMDISMGVMNSQLRILREVSILHEFEWLQSEVNIALQSHSN